MELQGETFFNYQKQRYFWLNLFLVVILLIWYIFDNPLGGPNGGTFFGYTSGIIGAVGIFYLTWYGIRKRAYYSKNTTLKGCLGAHVWLGLALLIIVPLHSGFSFGLNVHTLAAALMAIVVLSGIFGALQYSAFAPQIQSHRGGASQKELLDNLLGLDKQLTDRQNSVAGELIKKFNFELNLSPFLRVSNIPNLDQQAISKMIAQLPQASQQEALDIVSLITKKQKNALALANELAITRRLRLWLYLHLPFTVALIVALLIHIFTVLFYR